MAAISSTDELTICLIGWWMVVSAMFSQLDISMSLKADDANVVWERACLRL